MLRTQTRMSYGNSDDEFRVLVVGKAGNGKSALCNAILGDNKFKVGRGMTTTTYHAEYATTFKGNSKLKVVDTPDITNCRMSPTEMLDEVSKWRLFTMSKPSAVVLTVRCDIRYTAEEYAIYREIVRLWGDNSIKDNLLVAFTFGDCQDEPIEEELKTVCPELQSVLRDAGHRYFVFDKTSEQCRSGAAYTIMDLAQRMRKRGGEGEGEVSPVVGVTSVRRLAAFVSRHWRAGRGSGDRCHPLHPFHRPRNHRRCHRFRRAGSGAGCCRPAGSVRQEEQSELAVAVTQVFMNSSLLSRRSKLR